MKHYILMLISLAFAFAAHAQTDTLTNSKVIKLQKAGFNVDILKSKISTSPGNYDLSIDGMIALKKAGISEDVIQLMMGKPISGSATSQQAYSNQPMRSTPTNLESGIYYKSPGFSYTEIEPSVLTATKSSNAAALFISPLINSKLKVSISGKKSSYEIKDTTPSFVFVFDTTIKKNLNNDNNQWVNNARSPKEFVLVKLTTTANSRDLVVGKGNIVSENSGIDDKSVIKFSTRKISNGFYEITPEKPLKEGEYGIMFSQGFKKGESSKIFDFTIAK